MSSRSVIALLGVGLPTPVAEKLVATGLTITKLQQRSDEELAGYGLTNEHVLAIRERRRPHLPLAVVEELLYESGFKCVLCGATDIVIHHLEEWSRSRDHSPDNLVVLCLKHHGEAHTRREHSQGLDADKLRGSRRRHVADIRRARAELATTTNSTVARLGLDGFWDYFNHSRLTALAAEVYARGGLPEPEVGLYHGLVATGVLTSAAGFVPPHECMHHEFLYMTQPRFTAALRRVFVSTLQTCLTEQAWVSLSEDEGWKPGFIRRHVRAGALVVCKQRFNFRSQGTYGKGPGQMREVSCDRRNVRVHFVIDAWEATAQSAYMLHLTRTQETTAVLVVREVRKDQGHVDIRCTCLALGTGFGPTIDRPWPRPALERAAAEHENQRAVDEWLWEQAMRAEQDEE